MHIGLVIYGSLDSISGGYLFDRKLVEYLRQQGDTVDVISLPRRPFYALHLLDNLRYRNPREAGKPEAKNKKTETKSPAKGELLKERLDLIIQDELNHPSLLAANARAHPYPVVSLVHHLRHLEQRPAWENSIYRTLERRYLRSVDGFIFTSK